jgi:hypothetical protein
VLFAAPAPELAAGAGAGAGASSTAGSIATPPPESRAIALHDAERAQALPSARALERAWPLRSIYDAVRDAQGTGAPLSESWALDDNALPASARQQ